jgi:GH18 family chitinase
MDWSSPDAEVLTDIMYFALEPTEKGTFSESSLPTSHLQRLIYLKRQTKSRIILSVKSDPKKLSAIFANARLRKQFIESLKKICLKYKFDGIDVDYESPQTALDVFQFSKLILEATTVFHKSGLQVTLVQYPKINLGRKTYEHIDRVHLISFDHEHSEAATVYQARKDIEKLVQVGCPPEKIILGIPFFGRDRKGNSIAYSEIVRQRLPRYSPGESGPYSYNSARTIQEKIDLVYSSGLGGIMIWELGQDAKGQQSLLKAISEGVR